MSKSKFTMLAAAAVLAVTGLTAAPAGAAEFHGHGAMVRHGNLGQSHVVIRPNVRHFNNHGQHFRRHFGTRFYVAPVYAYRYHHDDCYWLRRKALNTGSRYWWHRYNECRWG